MTLLGLAARGFRHYRGRHVLVFLACTAATAVLTGALVAGDSVRASLAAAAEHRLGRTQFALQTGERLATLGLAEALSSRLGAEVAPALVIRGFVTSGSLAVQGVDILGVDRRFWRLLSAAGNPPSPGEAVLAARLADGLDAGAGSGVLVRFQKPLAMPLALTLAPDEAAGVSLRLTVRGVDGPDGPTRFSLRSGQEPPATVLVDIAELAAAAGVPQRANTFLVASGPATAAALDAALRSCLVPRDLGLRLEPRGSTGDWELGSERVYLDRTVVQSVRSSGLGVSASLAYLATSLEQGDRRSSYAFVAASETLDRSLSLGPGETALTSWAADEIGSLPGSVVTLRYFPPDGVAAPEERSVSLTVAAILPTPPPFSTAGMVPPFPGFAGALSCREWRPGVPVDLSRIGPRDEQYWKLFGMLPKAFVSFGTARTLWKSSFGEVTGVEIAGGGDDRAALERRILGSVDPSSVGFAFRDARAEALAAGAGGVDFGELFLALGAFIIVSAALLVGMLFGVGLREREREIGTLAALGFAGARLRLLYLAEGSVIAVSGAAAGACAGVGYAAALLQGLRTVWRGAIGSLDLILAVSPASLVIGAAGGIAACLVALLGASRVVRREPAELLARARTGASRRRSARALALVSAVGVVGLAAVAMLGAGGTLPRVTAFVAAGTMALAVLESGFGLLFLGLGSRRFRVTPGALAVGVRNLGRRPSRNLLALVCVSSGVFVVVAVGLNRVGVDAPFARGSGTGGFALVVQTSAPVPRRWLEGPDAAVTGAVGAPSPIVAADVRDGDDASCLNVNRAEHPRMLGLRPEDLDGRGAFRFAGYAPGVHPATPWGALEMDLGPTEIPAIVDATVLEWGVGKSLGDALAYTDDFGREVKLRLVGALESSVFQGSVIVSSRAFREHFPGSAGPRFLLIDAEQGRAASTAEEVRRVLRAYGAHVESAAERLDGFNRVENTYLSVFLLLGGLGVLLGSLCLGLVVARNVRESRAELALLEAVGFRPGRVAGVVLAEQIPVLAGGLCAGIAAAAVAVYPVVASSGGASGGSGSGKLVLLGALAGGVLAAGLGSAIAALMWARRGDVAAALRSE